MKKYKTALFIFRRDLRLEDNTALIEALQDAEKVLPIFIFTPEQTNKNPYFGKRSFTFLIESLQDLELALQEKKGRLYFFYKEPSEIVQNLIDKVRIDALYINNDYTPYSQKRDQKLQALCKKNSIFFHCYEDALLHPPEKSKKADKEPYTVFTPFYKKASLLPVQKPTKNRFTNYFVKEIPFALQEKEKLLPELATDNPIKGGRKEAVKILQKLSSYKNYQEERDYPYLDKTTHLSAYLKFTTISPREVFYKIKDVLGSRHPLIRQLYWRDFYTYIAYYFPEVFTRPFQKKYNKLHWDNDKKCFQAWCEGNTGFPLIDAAMREIAQTGMMHNRLRMIVASFLVKDLRIDWRWGEKHFAKLLIDYDPCVNNGNWQWTAGTGCDPQPYFRIFNPWLQQIKFDPECKYIKKWLPELNKVPPEKIHHAYEESLTKSYPKPIVDHKKEAAKTIQWFKKEAL